MSEILKAIILGVVQGLTEFLPISSSAHLLALQETLDFHLEGVAFDVSLHLATLLAVLIYFRGELIRLLRSDRLGPITIRIILATIPAAVLGFLIRDFRANIPVFFAVGGWCFSAAYLLSTRGRGGATPYRQVSIFHSVLIGVAQALSLFPGVSRSGATISAGLWLGLERTDAARFSFLLAIPAILGAGLLEGLELLENPGSASELLPLCAVGMPVALLVGLGAIHVLLRIVAGNAFHRFGWYNLAAALAFGTYLLLRA